MVTFDGMFAAFILSGVFYVMYQHKVATAHIYCTQYKIQIVKRRYRLSNHTSQCHFRIFSSGSMQQKKKPGMLFMSLAFPARDLPIPQCTHQRTIWIDFDPNFHFVRVLFVYNSFIMFVC